MKTRANQGTKSGLGTIVHSSGLAVSDKLVTRFNELNAAIVHGLPEMARSYETLHRHLPLLREMQGLLISRPKHAVGAGFTMLDRTARKTVRIAMPIGNSDQLPTWTQWITAYAAAIDYSVRQIRRLVLGEARMRTTKECGWSLFRSQPAPSAAATAGYELGECDRGRGGHHSPYVGRSSRIPAQHPRGT